MQTAHVPITGPRYWAALSMASIFGANMGDFVSHVMHLGHWRGLGPLALLFAVILMAEARQSRTLRPIVWRERYYWLAIVTLRTAATNLGDLATHDAHLSYAIAVAALGVLLALLAALTKQRAPTQGNGPGVPVTDAMYWLTMLAAGTFGTVAGDAVADALGLGTGLGSLVLGGAVCAALAWRSLPGQAGIATYWLAVTAIRTAGTTEGDYLAFRHGLNLGLPVSTAVTGFVLIVILAAWPRRSRLVPVAI